MSADKRHEIRDAFDLFDTEGKERLEAAELPIALRALGIMPSDDEVAALVKTADRKSTGGRKYDACLVFSIFSLLA